MMVYLIVLFILVILEMAYFRIAHHLNIVDKPNLRSSHKSLTIRGGGVIFLLGAWLWVAFFGMKYPWFMAGLTLISLISFVDDVHSVPNWIRLTVQFVAMFMMFHELDILHWNMWWVVIIAWIVCVGITNAYNFMDGINGITGGYSLAVLIPLMTVNGLSSSVKSGFIDQDLLIVITLSVLVFCFFNFRKKAKCFAGDVGAIGMAFILVFAIGLLIARTKDITYIMFLAVYGVDTVLTILHRIMLHEHLGEAHRKHAYQLLANELGFSHLAVSGFYLLLQLAISFGLIFLPVNHYLYSVIVLAVLCAGYILFMKKYYHLHEEYLKSVGK